MLNAFRSFASTWVGKILGGLLIIALAGFGVWNVVGALGTNTVATVAGEDITVRDYQRAYNNQLNRMAQQFGQMPTAEQAAAFGVPNGVLSQLGSDAAINKFGEELGLGVSEDRLSKLVREDPTFAGTLGGFDRDNFSAILQQNGYTEAEYFNLQTKAARRQQLVSGLLAGSPTPAVAAELINRYSTDTRTVDYFVLNAQSIPAVAEPTEADLAAYLKEHQADFRTKETRQVDLLVLSPETLASTKTVTEDEISAEYDRTKESRQKIEKRTIQQVALTTPELEKAFTEGEAAGTPVADLLAQTGAKPDDLGTRARSEVTDPDLAEAAFSLPLNGYKVIEGVGSKRAIIVSAIEAGGQITLADAHDEIKQQLALKAARDEYADMLDQIEELRAAFKPLPEIAQRFGLTVVDLTLTPGGPELSSDPSIPAEDAAKISSAIFDAEQGDLAPTIQMSSTRNIWFDLKKVEPARDQTLDEVRDAVVAAVTNQRTDEALKAEVAKVTEQLKNGTPFDDVAVSLNQFPSVSAPLKRSGDGTTLFTQQVANEVFNGGPDHFGSAVNGDGDYVVFHVVDASQGTEPPTAQIKQFVENSTRDTLYEDFRNGVAAEAGIHVNQQVFAQLQSLGTTQ